MEYAGAVMLNNSPAAQQFPEDDADGDGDVEGVLGAVLGNL
jgi:hypothetical protein